MAGLGSGNGGGPAPQTTKLETLADELEQTTVALEAAHEEAAALARERDALTAENGGLRAALAGMEARMAGREAAAEAMRRQFQGAAAELSSKGSVEAGVAEELRVVLEEQRVTAEELAEANAELASLNAGLEGAVAARTAEVTAANAALREREERLRLILDSATEYAIFTTDLDRRITSWNAGAERLLGWAERDILGRSADLIFTPEDRAAGVPEQEAAKALAEGRAENERWHLRRNGARFWASGLSMPLRDPAAGPQAAPLGLIAVMRDQTERRFAEARRALLTDELNHRVKNTLAVVQSLTLSGTRGASPDLSAFAAAFQRRVLALARAHDLLTREDWTGAPLGGVVRAVLAPLLADSDRVDLTAPETPDVFLPPGAALTLAMAVHELATNAVRHGALSSPSGRVRVVFRAASGGGGVGPGEAVEWVERGGPPIAGPPAQRGFGLRLLERGLAMQAGMKADIRFEPEGLHCILHLPQRRTAPNRRLGNG